MITFHPTITLGSFLKTLLSEAEDPKKRLAALFKANDSILTDSGRSALGVIIEALHLENTRMGIPAFLCTNLLPVLEHYHIEPVFIDSEENGYQFTAASYSGSFESALVVATYGRTPDLRLVEDLERRGIRVIEDYAHVSLPPGPETVIRPRLYSLGKTLAVPDGGLAVLPAGISFQKTLEKPAWSFRMLKNILKTWRLCASGIFWLRTVVSRTETTPPSWGGIHAISKITERFLSRALAERIPRAPQETYTYCFPITVENPRAVQKTLFAHGIIAEQIWNPIIVAVQKDAPVSFPNACKKAQETVCVPLWHIASDETQKRYEEKLKHVLSGIFAGFGK